MIFMAGLSVKPDQNMVFFSLLIVELWKIGNGKVFNNNLIIMIGLIEFV